MSSLYKRATPRQRVVLKMVEGAVKNAAHAHPEAVLPKNFARSVAKRAAGTLTANWRDVLASPVVESPDHSGNQPATSSPNIYPQVGKGRSRNLRNAKRLRSSPSQDRSLKRLHRLVGMMAGQAKRDQNPDRYEAFVEVLRVIAKLKS